VSTAATTATGPRYVRAAALDVLDSVAAGASTAGEIAIDTGRTLDGVYLALVGLRRRGLIAVDGHVKCCRHGPPRSRNVVTPLGQAVLHSRRTS
jgi:DNA-binding IclR family transcriptional regulator